MWYERESKKKEPEVGLIIPYDANWIRLDWTVFVHPCCECCLIQFLERFWKLPIWRVSKDCLRHYASADTSQNTEHLYIVKFNSLLPKSNFFAKVVLKHYPPFTLRWIFILIKFHYVTSTYLQTWCDRTFNSWNCKNQQNCHILSVLTFL